MKLTDQMSAAVKDIWAEYYTHPFVKGIEDGTLDREKFRYYIIQDYLYLIEYTKVFGIGIAKATAIVAAMELGRRREGFIVEAKSVIKSSADAFKNLSVELCDLDHEEFWVVMLSRANTVIEKIRLASGGIDATGVDIRMLLRRVLERNAVGVVIAHNHPSGSLSPSNQDRDLTYRIKQALQVMDIKLLDHIIVGGGSYFSFSDNNLL